MIGIPNFGNTCYAATCLQCLRHCRKFRSFVRKFTDSQPSQLMTLLDKFYSMLEDETCDMERVSRVANALIHMCWKRMSLLSRDQFDVHEFFIMLVDVLSKESSICQAHKVPLRLVTDEPFDPKLEKITRFMESLFYSSKVTVIEELFRGQHSITMKCLSCGHKRIGSDIFSSIHVQLLGTSLVDSFYKTFHAKEHLEGVECEACKKNTEHEKILHILRPPPVLIIVVNGESRQLTDIPETLDIASCLWKGICDTSTVYNLKSVACHVGNRNTGHYAAVCHDNRGWTLYDDTNVQLLVSPLAHLRHGYFFMYEQSEK